MKKIDYLKQLVSLVPEQEIKKFMQKGEDEFSFEAHFGLGGWIRNNWIYPDTDTANEVKSLFFHKGDIELCNPDIASSKILSELYKYLKKEYKKRTVNSKNSMEKVTKENSLYLTIKQVYFDQIINGTKTEEYREIKDTTYKKYLKCDENGNPFFDTRLMKEDDPMAGEIYVWNNGVYPYIPKLDLKYLSLAVGYAKERDTAIVEVTDISFAPMLNPRNEELPARFHFDENYNYVLDENGELCIWIAIFHLGKVVEVHRAVKK